MNDLDLRTALHRDADLVGEPSPDLLEQLGRRRQQQGRQRLGVAAAVLGVVVIAAGIPLGQSLSARSDGTATDPSPTRSVEVTPTTAPAAPTAPPAAPPVVEAPPPVVELPTVAEVPMTPEPADGPPGCPDTESLLTVLPDPGVEGVWYVAGDELNPPTVPQCSGDWAVTAYFRASHHEPGVVVNGVPAQPGDVGLTGAVGVFRYVDGSWTAADRVAVCDAGMVPAEIEYRACQTS